MGKYITRPVASSNIINKSRHYGHPSNLKIESKKIIEFIGRIEDRKKRKSRTECDFDGPRYDQVLPDALFEENKQYMNRIFYSQLAVATVGGTAHHLVKIFEDTKNWNVVWKSMYEWYDGDVIKNETAESLRSKKESYRLTSS